MQFSITCNNVSLAHLNMDKYQKIEKLGEGTQFIVNTLQFYTHYNAYFLIL